MLWAPGLLWSMLCLFKMFDVLLSTKPVKVTDFWRLSGLLGVYHCTFVKLPQHCPLLSHADMLLTAGAPGPHELLRPPCFIHQNHISVLDVMISPEFQTKQPAHSMFPYNNSQVLMASYAMWYNAICSWSEDQQGDNFCRRLDHDCLVSCSMRCWQHV